MNFELKDELRNLFNLIKEKNVTYKLLLNDSIYDSYYIVDNDYKGVGFEIGEEHIDFRYSFENLLIKVDKRIVNDGTSKYMIQLLSDKINDTDEFFYICMKFIEVGENNQNRDLILQNPQEWVDKWKILFGNKSSEERIYPFLGELICLRSLLKNGETAQLTKQGSHDIETIKTNYEVKTTTMRYDSLIEIHSKNQLASLNGNPLYLFFVRLEESIMGVSINSIIEDLKSLKYNISEIEEKTKKYNSESLEKTYKINEIRLYSVDEKFPKIVDDSFKDNKLPEGIYGLKYTVDLINLEYTKIEP